MSEFHELHGERILVLDFGSQTTQLIARRVRELKVYCEIHPYNMPIAEIRSFNPKGIILSGGPASVADSSSPRSTKEIFDLNVPILGICYGMQLMTEQLGGKVACAKTREYGRTGLTPIDFSDLFFGLNAVPSFQSLGTLQVWMSHGDRIEELPSGFKPIAKSDSAPIAAMKHEEKKWYGVQFHPEVAHTPQGTEILRNFVIDICGCSPEWSMHAFIDFTVQSIREKVGDRNVVCGLSGGVDSSVAAVLLNRAIGRQMTAIFVNNGLLRKGEAEEVQAVFADHFHMNIRYIDASRLFLDRLKGVTDPEKKRKIIGNTFIEVFEKEAHKIGKVDFLAQGTLYPDVIESVSFKGPSAVIKSHHNVGGLPETMKLQLIEPLRELFKDEVREVGKELGLSHSIVGRHPFPGPGLAIRILGEVTEDALALLREADAVVNSELIRNNLYDKVWQAFAVLLPIKTVGVMGDERTYENVIGIRIVDSLDAMTADWSRIPYDVLGIMSNRIINEVKGVNRVVYDISSKPPSTIEWE
ncbi:MAG: glutamine-hydrolyzing GMP synthase [Deltaproteobacteria bacterium]|nr:glutamine-hydrolyzing GMP synthase [Deltaproteobacteria bacterium]